MFKEVLQEVKKAPKEFVRLTRSLLDTYKLKIDCLSDIFNLDDQVFNRWYDALELAKDNDESYKTVMSMLIRHEDIEKIDSFLRRHQ